MGFLKKILTVCFLLLAVPAHGAIDCSGTGLQDALDALSGDGTTITCNSGTITFPAGGIDVDQGYAVKIDGGGVVVSSGGGILVKGTPGKVVEITGFVFGDGSTYPTAAGGTIVYSRSTGLSSCGLADCTNIVNIHGNTFQGNSTAGPVIGIRDFVTGVIYNNTFQGPHMWSMILFAPEVYGLINGGYQAAGYSWSQDTGLGGGNFVFVEGNTVNIDTFYSGSAFVDGNYGARWVQRFNTIKNANLGGHDSANYNVGEGGHQGTRATETYNNDMHYTVGYTAGMSNARGGGGVFYNNRLRSPKTTSDSYCGLQAYRRPTVPASGTVSTDLATAAAEDAGGVEVTSASVVFSGDDVDKGIYIYSGTGWTAGQWCEIASVDGSTATLDCTDVSDGSNSGALSGGTFLLSTSPKYTWGTFCGDSLEEKMCMFNGMICVGDGNGDCPNTCGDGDDTCGPCIPVDTPIDGRTYPLCRGQIGSGKHNEATGAQAAEPFYAWKNYYCASPASFNLNSPDGDEVPCRVKMGSTSFPTSPVTSVGKSLYITASTNFTGGYYTISAVDGDGYGLLSQGEADVACGLNDGATGNTNYRFDLYADAGDCPEWYELTYADMISTASQVTILETDFVVQSAAPETYSAFTCPHPLASTNYTGKECDYTLYGTSGYGTKNSTTAAAMGIGSGTAMSIGSGAVMTLQ